MSDSPDRPFVSPYHCRDCGSDVGFRSRRRSFADAIFYPYYS